MNRFKRNRYSLETVACQNHQFQIRTSDDGTLFSGTHRTRILPQDLPEWYVFGRYYKLFGYMSTKGITDLLYVPNMFVNHFLKDDALYISYGGKIIENPLPVQNNVFRDKYIGYDEVVWGGEIISILKGATIYSNFDISNIVEQIKAKKKWLVNEYPDEFGPERWHFDVDECFNLPFENRIPPKMYAITLDDYFTPSFTSLSKRYYGTLTQIRQFVAGLDYEEHKTTVDAFYSYMAGNTEATHMIAYAECKLLEPVTRIKDTPLFLNRAEWDFKNVWGSIYKMHVEHASMTAVLVKDGERYIRCILPEMEGLSYRSDIDGYQCQRPVQTFWGQPGIFKYSDKQPPTIKSTLFLAERKYNDVKAAVGELPQIEPCLDAVCEDIFADG